MAQENKSKDQLEREYLVAALAGTLPTGGGGLTDAQLRASPVGVSGTVAVSNPTANPETGLAKDATITGVAKDGTDITTPTPAMPAGGVGIRGWLSAIWTKLNGSLAVTGTFWQATQPVSGTFFQTTQPVSLATAPVTPVTGTFFQATQPVSIATNTPDVTDRAGRLVGVVTVSGTVADKQVRSATGANTSPSITTASATVLASNANRLGGTIYNESGAVLYLLLGATASVTAYTLQVAVGGYYEIPFNYTGVIAGITSAGTAVLRVTELT